MIRHSQRFRLFHRGAPFYGENIIYRAFSAALRRGIEIPPVEVECFKALPAGGGVGAGSGNCGAFLRWAFLSCCRPLDVDLAAELGSDVPFLSSDLNMAWGEGRGDVLTPVPWNFPPLLCLVGFPGWSIPTPMAYGILDEIRGKMGIERLLPGDEEFLRYFDYLMQQRVVGVLPNDFLPVAEKIREEYIKIWDTFEFASALAWGLCGSGSGFFGLFRDHEGLCRAISGLRRFDFVKSLIPVEVYR